PSIFSSMPPSTTEFSLLSLHDALPILIAQLFLNLGIDLLDGFLVRNFKEAPASLLGKLLQDFFAVRMILLRKPAPAAVPAKKSRSEEHTSELQSPDHLVCRLLLEKKK